MQALNRFRRFVILSLATGSLVSCAPPVRVTSADAAAAPSTQPAAPKPIVLFDGTSLDRWDTQSLGENPNWSVKDGILTCTAHGPALATNDRFADFDLHVEFSLPKQSNSGIFLRGRYEIQLIDSWPDPLKPTQQCGSLYGIAAPSDPTAYRNGTGEWNTLDIRIVGRTVTVTMNGTRIVDAAQATHHTSGGADSDDPGPITLQAYGSGPGARFRNVTIRPLN